MQDFFSKHIHSANMYNIVQLKEAAMGTLRDAHNTQERPCLAGALVLELIYASQPAQGRSMPWMPWRMTKALRGFTNTKGSHPLRLRTPRRYPKYRTAPWSTGCSEDLISGVGVTKQPQPGILSYPVSDLAHSPYDRGGAHSHDRIPLASFSLRRLVGSLVHRKLVT